MVTRRSRTASFINVPSLSCILPELLPRPDYSETRKHASALWTFAVRVGRRSGLRAPVFQDACVDGPRLGGGYRTVFLSEDLLADPVLLQRPSPQAQPRVAAHQLPVGVLVATVLLQNLVASPDALLVLAGLHVVRGEFAQHVHVGVLEALSLDHRPVLVEVLDQVVLPVQFYGPLVLDGRVLYITLLFQATTFLAACVELVHVGPDPDVRRETIVAV